MNIVGVANIKIKDPSSGRSRWSIRSRLCQKRPQHVADGARISAMAIRIIRQSPLRQLGSGGVIR